MPYLPVLLVSILLVLRLQVYGSQTFWPGSIPLAVRTPYLNAWMPMQAMSLDESQMSSNTWPVFWNQAVLGWLCYIRVDGRTWTLFGHNNLNNTALGDYAIQWGHVIETVLTPTRTIQVVEAGQINITITFLSPINPTDLVQQSLPFSYVGLEFSSLDGQPHEVELYSDISAPVPEWLNGFRGAEVNWTSSGQRDNMIYHQVELVNPAPFQEYQSQASDGIAYYAMSTSPRRNISWQACRDEDCREEFIYAGGLNSQNSSDAFRAIDDAYPVFGISVSLGKVSSSDGQIVWSIGYVRDPSINYTLLGQSTTLRPFYTTKYETALDALADFVSSYSDALSNATQLDARVRDAASVVTSDGKLFDILCLVTRQVFSSLEITAPDQAGSPTRVFMKDMGYSRRATPVESLYASLPLFLYYNPSLLQSLLVPLLEQQNHSSLFPYSGKDLGASFPMVSGPTLSADESLDPTEDMLIMALAYAQYANDTSTLHEYYGQLRNWAEYLIDARAQFPDELPLDKNSTTLNSTNFAVKGIFAIQAMSEISHLVNESDDSYRYSRVASTLMSVWVSLALSERSSLSMLTTFGGQQNTWSLPYNLYLQNMLGLELMNDTVLNELTTTYGNYIHSADYVYGLPDDILDNTPGNLAWNAWTAAVFTDNGTRGELIDAIWRYASNNATQSPGPWPLSLTYDVQHGTYNSGTMSPALGGVFAPLIHQNTVYSGIVTARNSSHNRSKPIGAIVGGAVGCLIGISLAAGAIFWTIRHRGRKAVSSRGTMKLTPFVGLRPDTSFLLEKRERDPLTRQQMLMPLSHSHLRRPSSLTVEEGPSLPLHPMRNNARRLREEELADIRQGIEELRMFVQSSRIEPEARESTELGAPPDYSSFRRSS